MLLCANIASVWFEYYANLVYNTKYYSLIIFRFILFVNHQCATDHLNKVMSTVWVSLQIHQSAYFFPFFGWSIIMSATCALIYIRVALRYILQIRLVHDTCLSVMMMDWWYSSHRLGEVMSSDSKYNLPWNMIQWWIQQIKRIERKQNMYKRNSMDSFIKRTSLNDHLFCSLWHHSKTTTEYKS